MDLTLLAGAGAVACSALLGIAVMPKLADTILKKKHDQIMGAFERKLAEFTQVEHDVDHVDAKVAESAMKWASQMAYMESIGKVEPTMARKLADAGIIDEARPDEDYVCIPEDHWGMPSNWKTRLVMGVSMGGLAAVMALPWLLRAENLPTSFALPVGVLLLFVVVLAVACDVRAKVIPYQLCAVAAVPSLVLAVLTWGVEGLPGCVLSAFVATGCLWGASKLGEVMFGVKGSIGMGDIRLLPWTCLPLGATGTLYGAACGFGVMCIVAISVLATGRFSICSKVVAKLRSLAAHVRHIVRNALGYVTSIAYDPVGFAKRGERETKRRDPAKYLAMGPGIAVWLASGYAIGTMCQPLL